MYSNYFCDWYLNNKDYSVLLAGLKSISMGSTINSLYPVAILDIYLPSNLIEDGDLSIGSPCRFDFIKNGTDIKISREYKVWKIFNLNQDSARSMSGFYTIHLIHPWYFNQTAQSKAYYGTTFLTLAQVLLQENYMDFTLNLDETKDYMNKHFRTYQTQGDFIESRILPKYLIDNSPTFMWVNDNKEFYARSFNTMLNKDQGNVAIDSRRISESATILSNASDKDRLMIPLNINYALGDSGTLWNRFATKSTFLYNDHTSKTPMNLTNEDSSYFNKGYFPIHASLKNIKEPLSIYINDNENNIQNIYSEFLTKQKSILLDHVVKFSCPGNLNISVGESITLYIKKYEEANDSLINDTSLFQTRYVIHSINNLYKDSQLITTVSLIKDMITPEKVELPLTSSGYLS